MTHQLGILQEIIGDELGAQRIARHKHNGRNGSCRGTDVETHRGLGLGERK